MASITKYVKEHYFDEVSRAGIDYFVQNALSLGLLRNGVSGSIDVEFSEIKYVYAGNRDDDLIDIDVILNIYADVVWFELYKTSSSQKKNRWLRVSCTARVEGGLHGFQIHKVTPYKKGELSLFERPFTDELVPFLWKDELDDTAEAILRLYYPDALKSPMQINPYILAQTLGLSVEFREINPDTSIFGRIYFEDDTEQEISEMTIVIDKNLEKIRPSGTVNNTIVHECLHWILHRYSVELEKGSADSVAQISTTEEAVETDWMEWQVHSLAHKIMMPKAMTQQFLKLKFAELKENRQVNSMIDIIEDLIKATANYFGVTIIAAQKRLVEFGIEEAKGAFNYVDGRYVPAHSWQKGFLGVDQTFSIGVSDLSQLVSKHESLRHRLSEGGLIYAESHICLNDSKYITINSSGLPELTEYAKTHMEECCLVFEKKSISHNKAKLSFAKTLDNSVDDSVTSQFHYPNSDENLKLEEEASMLMSHGNEIKKVLNELPPDFGGALEYLRDWRDMTNQELAFTSLISERSIYNLLNNSKEPKMRTVVALSVALSLPHKIAYKFLELSGRTLRTQSNDEEMLLDVFMMATGNFTVEHCNLILAQREFSLLTRKKEL
jgi:hypothetical protein